MITLKSSGTQFTCFTSTKFTSTKGVADDYSQKLWYSLILGPKLLVYEALSY